MKQHSISFVNAGHGIWTAIITQTNIRIHIIVGSLVIFLSSYLHITFDQVIDLILTISVVLVAEMVNTSLEFLSDAVTLEHNLNIKYAKDVAAGAVLISAIFAIFIGIIIFAPQLLDLLSTKY